MFAILSDIHAKLEALSAGYALVEGELVRFRRVEYDVETTIRKIRDLPDLDDFHGDRLRDGR